MDSILNPKVILITWPVILFSLSLHEFLHAWMADRLGDPTARYAGRLTINPIAHYDLVGTTLVLLFRTFGWAKPVPVNAAVFRWPKRDMMLTALAGPATNFALALICVVVFKLAQTVNPDTLGDGRATFELAEKMVGYGIGLNLLLAIFNLIPVFPLDGHHILQGFLSYNAAVTYDRMSQFSPFLLVAVVIFGGHIIMPIRDVLLGVLLGPEEWRRLMEILSQLR